MLCHRHAARAVRGSPGKSSRAAHARAAPGSPLSRFATRGSHSAWNHCKTKYNKKQDRAGRPLTSFRSAACSGSLRLPHVGTHHADESFHRHSTPIRLRIDRLGSVATAVVWSASQVHGLSGLPSTEIDDGLSVVWMRSS